MTWGEYEVTGNREYRGHPHGTTFVARLDPGAERRAVARGDIRLLRRIEPALVPGSYQLPPGWAADNSTPTEEPKGSSLV